MVPCELHCCIPDCAPDKARVIELTGLPSGTVYPALRRLEHDGLVRSHWEQQALADAEQRPLRKYYKLTRIGKQRLRNGMETSKIVDCSTG